MNCTQKLEIDLCAKINTFSFTVVTMASVSLLKPTVQTESSRCSSICQATAVHCCCCHLDFFVYFTPFSLAAAVVFLSPKATS